MLGVTFHFSLTHSHSHTFIDPHISNQANQSIVLKLLSATMMFSRSATPAIHEHEIVEESSNSFSSSCSSPEDESNKSQMLTLADEIATGSTRMKVTNDTGSRRDWTISGMMDSLRGKVVIRSASGRVRAVIVRQMNGFRILGRVPAYPDQAPHAVKVNKKLLYPWATVSKKPFSSKMVVTHDNSPVVLEAERIGPWFGGSRVLRVTELETGRLFGLIRHYFENGSVSKSRWQVMTSPENHPNIMLCLVAIMNKSMGRIIWSCSPRALATAVTISRFWFDYFCLLNCAFSSRYSRFLSSPQEWRDQTMHKAYR